MEKTEKFLKGRLPMQIKKSRTLKKEIMQTFGLLLVAVSVIFGAIYYLIMNNSYRESAFDRLEQRAALTSQHMSNIIQQMESACIMVISDREALQAIQALAHRTTASDSYVSDYFSDPYTAIRNQLNSYYVQESFYRMVFFNECGDVIAGQNIKEKVIRADVNYNDLIWADKIEPGSTAFIPCHTDEWGEQEETVLSLVRRLVGSNMGYLEVQMLKDDLDELFTPDTEEGNVLFYDMEGNLLYSFSDEETDYFSCIEDSGFQNISKNLRMERLLFSSCIDKKNGIITVAAQKSNLGAEAMQSIIPVLLLLMVFLYVLALGYIWLSTNRIVKPISALQKTMENTDLNNMVEQDLIRMPEDTSIEEIQILYQAYYRVLRRLNDSMKKEKQLSKLQLQAQMDLLQAQVNPHFLYNTLNVISLKGMMANDESICDICSALSQMLRYSTNTKEKIGTVQDEVNYLKMYLQLMKYRYEHRLDYDIIISPEIESEKMPRVVLEQLVENSIQHGYSGNVENMKIRVVGLRETDGWSIRVYDNGCGFRQGKIDELERQFGEIRRQLSREREHIEFEIGGMGIVSVYARMYLVYDGRLQFELRSDENGTVVVIRVSDAPSGDSPQV